MKSNTADILHDTAMDYFDLGKIAKAKGKLTVYQDYINKAYILDKEAAIKKFQDKEDDFWKYIYLRSAAWLAIDCNKWEEAGKLAEFGLQGNPSPTEAAQFEEILEKVRLQKDLTKSFPKQSKDTQRFIGILTSADIFNSFIIINSGQSSTVKFKVPLNNVYDLVKMFWGTTVEVFGSIQKNGEFTLKNIQKAA